MNEKSRVVDELCDLHMDFLSEVRVSSYPSFERVMFPAPSKIIASPWVVCMLWYHSLRSPFWWVVSVAPGGKKAELCKKKSCLKNIFLYPCGPGTGVAPAWVSLHALLPGRPILIQYCAINTSTVQRGLYEILTVTIQMNATSTCNFWISSRNEVQKVDYKNVQFPLY